MKLLSFLKAKKERGASLVEYAILVALIALAVIVVVGILGQQINGVFTTINQTLNAAISGN
ncbi:MAG: Flp family type IVb pilin [Gammaproteobacteria bacterium]|nr:Flp family type IVb pilin [Pseudomonadales bacterium]MCP5348223.1 Flp family type IVb pilin [Pseudomonadales bacterium]